MPMKDGFRTLIGINNAINRATFAEVTVKPFGLDSRGPIDITSMRNVRRVTKWPKQLVDITDMTASCQWDPSFWMALQTLFLGVNSFVSVTFPNLQQLQTYGWLDKADPQEHKESEVPLINLTIVASNTNPGDGSEWAPTLI